jgi:glycosyltransferase involved in cell wall biosynthesis
MNYNKTPLISVVVITYNQENYIEQAINSILEQEFEGEFEIIIGEDCSSDNTQKMCKKIKAKFNNIKLISQVNNIGVTNNFIQSIDACKGEYIAFCEGDDYWIDKKKLSKQVELLDRNKHISMVFTNRIIVNGLGEFLRDDVYAKDIYTLKDVWEGFIAPTQAILARNLPGISEFIRRNNHGYGGDRLLTLYCAFFGDLYRLNEKTVAYRDSGLGVWSSYRDVEKLIGYKNELKIFYIKMGIPINNEVMGKVAMNLIISLNFYYLKRPILFLKSGIIRTSIKTWREFRNIPRFKFLIQALILKIKVILGSSKKSTGIN